MVLQFREVLLSTLCISEKLDSSVKHYCPAFASAKGKAVPLSTIVQPLHQRKATQFREALLSVICISGKLGNSVKHYCPSFASAESQAPLPALCISGKLGHYSEGIMSAVASQITGISIVYSIVCSGADQRKHQSYASLAFVPVTGEFSAQRASDAENVSIWWRHQGAALWSTTVRILPHQKASSSIEHY